eukprot:CAMPEP_0114265848 /NCGR_PEP_ID=MMETSP0058-20121206/24215_1 /TAXON_ID=36894 /ORGANISM="Pyramimonas parkeae, CCMP726" /LENGTH=326 /DNA_ID=CAMNT_0001383129 /DNA_START=202 /DNA_END=1179 /DNA_ORIENTATION=-
MASELQGVRVDAVEKPLDEQREIEHCWACGARLNFAKSFETIRSFAEGPACHEDASAGSLRLRAQAKARMEFRCSWCEAVVTRELCPKAGSLTTPKEKKQPRSQTCLAKILSCSFVGPVYFLIISIIGVGIGTMFPILFSKSAVQLVFHSMLALFLGFNALFNYSQAVFSSAGTPSLTEPVFRTEPLDAKDITVPKGAYAGYKFCEPCNRVKPPSAHHCRMCNNCVLDMDHHCPFIGNCVGRNNLRCFLLFLLYASVSCLYVVALVICCLYATDMSLTKFVRMIQPHLDTAAGRRNARRSGALGPFRITMAVFMMSGMQWSEVPMW